MIIDDLQYKILGPWNNIYKAVYLLALYIFCLFLHFYFLYFLSYGSAMKFPNHTLLFISVCSMLCSSYLQSPPLHLLSSWETCTHLSQCAQLKDHPLQKIFPLSLSQWEAGDSFLWTYIYLWSNPSHTASNYLLTQRIP